MPEKTREAGHPLDRQNALERAIQLEGSKDPSKFKMPDGRTLAEVRQSNEVTQQKEYQEETMMIARRTREMSIPEFSKGKDLVVTQVGNIIDVTAPPPIKDNVTMATSRTTMSELEAGIVKPPSVNDPKKSMESMDSFTQPPTPSTTPPVSGSKGGTQ